MSETIRIYLPFVMSGVTLWMTWLAGDKHPKAWAVGLGNQVLWSIWIIADGAWGLAPMNIGMWALYLRNHFKWNAPAVPRPITRPEALYCPVCNRNVNDGDCANDQCWFAKAPARSL